MKSGGYFLRPLPPYQKNLRKVSRLLKHVGIKTKKFIIAAPGWEVGRMVSEQTN
jgi:hypothetical protein